MFASVINTHFLLQHDNILPAAQRLQNRTLIITNACLHAVLLYLNYPGVPSELMQPQRQTENTHRRPDSLLSHCSACLWTLEGKEPFPGTSACWTVPSKRVSHLETRPLHPNLTNIRFHHERFQREFAASEGDACVPPGWNSPSLRSRPSV